MPLKLLTQTELHRLYDEIFHPFDDDESNFDPNTHQMFEKIRTECKYYTTTTAKKPTFNLGDGRLSVLHLNVRSLLNTEKFEALTTFLYLTGIQWDIICISETWLNC